MTYGRFGVIAFFGIFIPGAYFTGIIFLSFASVLELSNLGGHYRVFELLRNNIVFFSTVLFLISYFLGVLVRLVAPRFAEKLSTIYLKHFRRKKDIWATDTFPYSKSLTERLKKDGIYKVIELTESLNNLHGRKNNTPFFNFCKLFITANEPDLSKQVLEAEAFTRFLSGTTLTLVIATIVFTILSSSYFIFLKNDHFFIYLYSGLLFLSLFSLLFILATF